MGALDIIAYVVSALVAIVGIGFHLIVILYCNVNASDDRKKYSILMRIHSSATIVRIICGLSVLMRHIPLNNSTTVMISYGLSGHLGPRFVSVVDAIGAHLVTFCTLMIPWCTLYRTLNLHDRCPSRIASIVITALVYLLCLPFGGLMILHYKPTEHVYSEMTNVQIQEVTEHSSYVIDFADWEIWYQLPMLYIAVIAFGITMVLIGICCWFMYGKKHYVPAMSRAKHIMFLKVLAAEAFSLLIQFIPSGIRLVLAHHAPDQLYYVISLFNNAIMASTPLIQGFAYVYFIPHLRGAIKPKIGIAVKPPVPNENSDVAQESQPQNPNVAQEPQPQNPNVALEPQPQNPNVALEPQPQNPNVVQEPQPQNPNVAQEAQPQNPNVAQEPQPQNPNVAQEPQPQNPNVAQEPPPQSPNVAQEPQPQNPNVAQELQ